MSDNTYVIIDIDLIIKDMVDESLNTDESFTVSIDGSLSILKFKDKRPNSMGGYPKYTNDQIKQLIDDNPLMWGDTKGEPV